MDASDAGPEHVAGLCPIVLAVQRGFDLATQDEIGLFVGVVVQADRDAWQVLDEQQAMMARAELLVDQPLQKDTFESSGLDPSLISGRNLSNVEVAEQVAVDAGGIETRRLSWYGRSLEKERVAFFARRLRLGSRHLQPAYRRGTSRAPRVHRADLERPEIAGPDAIDVVADTDDRLAAQDVEALLVGVNVRRNRAAGCQLGDAETGVDRSGSVIDERPLAVAVAVALVDRMARKRGRVEVPEVMHGVLISNRVEAYKSPTSNPGGRDDAAGHSLYRRRDTWARAAA